MLSTTITACIIALLGGAAAYYSWNDNRTLSLIVAVVATLSAAVAVVAAFLGAVIMIFRLIPLLLLFGLLWLLWRRFAD
ncbi:hypothetical protein [Corynebacterium pacaense]|uniref:hypothetical protein n=1 Tax=Corynebacterium pacaense TaxID=1816684 RepID=UPI0009B9771D|nr:hypothetical protein [Corynebacterium pacaense]